MMLLVTIQLVVGWHILAVEISDSPRILVVLAQKLRVATNVASQNHTFVRLGKAKKRVLVLVVTTLKRLLT
jgi:hypothetical protein